MQFADKGNSSDYIEIRLTARSAMSVCIFKQLGAESGVGVKPQRTLDVVTVATRGSPNHIQTLGSACDCRLM
jgi:hypothetical protein